MDSFAAFDKTPFGSLGCGPVFQAREPDEGRSDGAAVGEVDDERVAAHRNRLRQRLLNFISWGLH